MAPPDLNPSSPLLFGISGLTAVSALSCMQGVGPVAT